MLEVTHMLTTVFLETQFIKFIRLQVITTPGYYLSISPIASIIGHLLVIMQIDGEDY